MRVSLIVVFLITFVSFPYLNAQHAPADPLMQSYQLALEQYHSASYALAYQSFSDIENVMFTKNMQACWIFVGVSPT